MEEKTYEIGGRRFIQRSLVWGQAKQILKEIEGVELPSEYSVQDILKILEGKLPSLIAIVLIPEGETARTKDNKAITEFFEWEMSIDQMAAVVEDFFGCNPIPLWFEKVTSKLGTGTQGLEKYLGKETGLTETSPSSAEETSPSER